MNNILINVRSILTSTSSRWMELARNLPGDLLAQTPAPGEWSAIECLQHSINAEYMFQSRLDAFREGRDLQAFDPSQGMKTIHQPPLELAREFARRREESLLMLETITTEDFDRKSQHPELGLVTLGEMLHQWAAHDLNHIVQAERALMQPFLHGCGAWQKFFTGHMVVARNT